MEKLADWYLSLDTLQFKELGSLQNSVRVPIGPEITKQPALPKPPFFLGPFSSAKERYLAVIDYVLHSIVSGAGTIDPIHTLETYVLYLWVRGLVANCEEMESGPYYVAAGEEKSDRFLFLDDWHLTAVLDWDW